ncbi:MAG: hypothetical protein CVV27_11265, partial [Candidatus Melainabacteria bacterium HGW-Melainabacteria-1]
LDAAQLAKLGSLLQAEAMFNCPVLLIEPPPNALQLAKLVQRIERARLPVPSPDAASAAIQLISSFSDMLVLSDRSGRRNYVNPAAERITGFSLEELMHTPVPELVHPEDLETLHLAQAQCLARPGEPVRYEFRHLRKDGGFVPLEAIASNMMAVPELNCLVVTLRDISQRDLAQTLIQASEQRYRIVAEQTGQMVYDWDVATGRIHWAGAIEHITGFLVEDYQDVDIQRWEDMIHPEDRELAMETLQRAEATEGRYTVEYRLQHRDGSYVTVEDNGIFLMHEPGRAYRMLGSMKDISERRRASQALQLALHEREVLLQEIHHRVKNNFQVIISLLSLQMRKLKDAAASQHLLDARSRIRSLALIHEKLYQLPNMADIDLSDYLTLIARELHAARQPDAEPIHLTLKLEPVHVQVEQAIPCGLLVNELLTNVYKHAFANQHCGERQVLLRVCAEAGEILLEVSDSGCGISERALDDTSQTLGLQLVRQLVRQLQGHYSLHGDGGTHWQIRFGLRVAAH